MNELEQIKLELSQVQPICRRVIPVRPLTSDELLKVKAGELLESLGYFDDSFDDSDELMKHCKKYFDVKEYDETAKKIHDLCISNRQVPQDMIDYMLKIKKIREKYNLY